MDKENQENQEKPTLKEYNKKYYEEHKEKMKAQIKALTPEMYRRRILAKLNEGGYSRTPYTKLKKYDIKYDEETKKYS